MNDPIDSSLLINKYFEQVDNFIQYADNRNMPYKATQVIQNVNHVMLISGLYTDTCKKRSKKDVGDQT